MCDRNMKAEKQGSLLCHFNFSVAPIFLTEKRGTLNMLEQHNGLCLERRR